MNDLVLVDESQEIRKAETLVKSRYKLNPLALKLITTLISSVQNNDEIDQVYSISVSNFINISESKNKDTYNELKKACYEIMSKPIEIGKKGTKDFLMMNWASSCEYKNGEGIIEFQISHKLFPYILNLKKGNFLTYGLENILKLNSDYSIRMYEFLKDVYNCEARYGKKAEAIFEVDFLRDRLQVPTSYDGGKFRVRVIEKAQKDLKENCDIKFDWEVATKLGKKIHSIKFKIYPNNKNIEANKKLPYYLENFTTYSKYIREKYKNNNKFFINLNFDIFDKKEHLAFSMDDNGLCYGINLLNKNRVELNKEQSAKVYNASYICAREIPIYRSLIEDNFCIVDYARNIETKSQYGMLKSSIIYVFNKFDYRQKPLF